MRLANFLLVGIALAQEYYDYTYYGESTIAPTTPAPTTVEQSTTTIVSTTLRSSARPVIGTEEPEILFDFIRFESEVEEPEEEQEEPEEAFEPRFQNPFSQTRTETTPVYVSPINNMNAELLAGGDITISWDFDSTHDAYLFDYVTLVGNYENTTDYQILAGVTLGVNGDNTRTEATFTPMDTNTIYKIRVTPQDNDLVDGVANSQEIEVQSATTVLTHQPGAIYAGGSGFVGQVLLVNDFSDVSYVRTDAFDSVGYVTAVKIQFPPACTNIRIDASVDNNYIFTDAAIADTHRIFIFPQTHFSNQLSGPVKAFRYYVSGMGGCVTDPAVDVTVTTSLEYLTVDTLNADSTTTPQNVTLTAMWPSGTNYPPTEYTEMHTVWFQDLIQQATHLGPSAALSAPAISFTTGVCSVLVNLQEEGKSPGWGFLTTYDSNLAMTDLSSDPGTSNSGSTFNFRAQEWLDHIGVSIRYDTDDSDCAIIVVAATISYVKMDSVNYTLTTAVNPTQ